MFEVEIYSDKNNNCPIEDYINELNQKAINSKKDRIILKKILEYIKILERYRTRAGLPYMKYIQDDIWELRPIKDRIFFAYYKENTFLLLHYYKKKTRKAPQREIQKAIDNLKEYIARSEKNE